MLSAVESEREETHQLFLENNESIQVICTKHSNKTEFFSMGISAGNQILLIFIKIFLQLFLRG